LLTLAAAGWIRPDGSDRTRWMLTAKVLDVARNVANDQGLRDAARPVLERLRGELGDSVLLAVPDGTHWVLADFVEGTRPVRVVAATGSRFPMHAGANGKAILAHLPEDELDHLIDEGLPALTDATITSSVALRREIARVRRAGYAISEGEVDFEMAGLAAPVLDGSGRAVASVGVSAPSRVLVPGPALDRFVVLVADAVAEIGDRLARTP
jgi:IclR family acetate operon transcriptional repressor